MDAKSIIHSFINKRSKNLRFFAWIQLIKSAKENLSSLFVADWIGSFLSLADWIRSLKDSEDWMIPYKERDKFELKSLVLYD